MLKDLQEQPAACQQHHGEGCLDDDEGMLEPVAARARCAAPSFTQPVLWEESRPAQRGCKSEGQCGGNGYANKRIRRHDRGPARRNGAQTVFCVVEVNPILAPVMAIRDQLELLASQRMVRMGYLEVDISNVAMRCS